MLGITFNLASFGPSIGPSVTAIGYIGRGATKEATGPPKELIVPWQDVQKNPPVFSLLSWHTEVSKFVGRETEMSELHKWATSKPAISIKFITAEGGAGKSRIAGEFAREMQKQDWAAGFVDLRKPECFTMNKEGTLLVIDYPEENRGGIKELLQDLTLCGKEARLRVLFLTRQLIDQWKGFIRDCNALNLVDMQPIELGRLNGDDAYKLFYTTQEQAAKVQQTVPFPVKKEDFLDWLYRDPENERPLFIVASAAKSALDPEEPVFGYKGREIIESLAERELSHLRKTATRRNVKDEYVFARILAMAAIADILSVDYLTHLSETDELSLGFSAEYHVGDELEAAGLLIKDVVRAPKPDILAAAFTVRTLARNPKTAPEIIWACLSQDVSGCIERLGRLSFDAEITLQMIEHRLGEWLSEALINKVERCTSCWQLATTAAPIGLRSAAITICQTLLKEKHEDEERSLILNNLSNHLSEVGDTAGALDAIKEGVDICRKLSEASPQRYLPDLAMSLNNLSAHLSDVGDTAGALDAIKEAVDIYRKLSEASPQRYLPDLATSLNNLSNRLSAVGDTAGALDAIKEAVDIYRKLSEASPQRYMPDLAMSLNNLSGCLSDVGDTAGALDAIKEAVDIYRKLSEASPQRYLPDLASSLNNLSIRLSAVGDTAGALDVIKESVDIGRKLSEASPQRYLPELALSLNNLSAHLSAVGDTAGALDAIKESVDIRRKLSEASPQRYLPDLAMSLNNLSNRLSEVGDATGALDVIKEAVDFYRKLSEASPQRYLPDLAKSMGTHGLILVKIKDYHKAEEFFSEGVDLIRPFAEKFPKSPFERLLESLESNLERARRAGH